MQALPGRRSPPSACRVRLLVGLLIAFTLAAGLGLWSTWIAVEHPPAFGSLRAGPWTALPDRGGLDADPYERAVVARSGEAPLPASDAIVFNTIRDSAGARLRGTCDYRLEGEVPPSRFWTLAVYDRQGGLVPNPADRYGLSSADMIRDAGGPWIVELAPQTRPNNWLPTPAQGPFMLVLRLYETTGLSQLRAGGEESLPAVRRGACR